MSVDPRTPLAEVTFCVLDLETTGTSDEHHDIVEVGAILVRGGERLGSFQTMVRHPLAGAPCDRPSLGSVLSSLLEFMRGAVVVGHNVRFDLRFLNAALWKEGRDETIDPSEALDTVPLARRLLRDDVDDCRLGTLANRFEFDTRPTHRAFADAAATVELLHLLIERSTHYGAVDLADLMSLARLLQHRHRASLVATARVPRVAGVACLVNRRNEVLHVVRATDLRHAVRRLFDVDDTARVAGTVLQHLHRVLVVHTEHPVVAYVAELRWTAAMTDGRRPAMVYLCVPAAGAPRLRVTADRVAAGVVAGPFQRPLARQVAAAWAASPASVAALAAAARTSSPTDAMGRVPLQPDGTLDGRVMAAIAEQRSVAAARSYEGWVEVGQAMVEVADGRVVDVRIGDRSLARCLPMLDDDRTLPPTAAHAREALFVAELIGAQSTAGTVDRASTRSPNARPQ